MSEMVERMCRAVAKVNGVDPDALELYIGAGRHVPMWQLYEAGVRASIEAMRMPTETMLSAGDSRDDWDTASAWTHWEAMIDEALK